MAKAAISVFVLLLLSVGVQSRFSTGTSSSVLISDGIRHGRQSSSVLLLERESKTSSSSSSDTCDQTYGFLPCTTTVVGNLFLVAVYGYFMYRGATYLSEGSEILLGILGPGIIGGLLLPILGALPDAMLILVSGLFGTTETAQKQVLIGMGLLAGSTVMLVTLLWGSCVIVGKCDLSERSTATGSEDIKGFSVLTRFGITTDKQTSYAARIMIVSVIPFIIVQIPLVFNLSSGKRIAILVGLIVSILSVLAYCLYQVFYPWVQKRKLAYVKHKHIMAGILNHAEKEKLRKLLTDDGEPDKEAIKKLFLMVDQNNNGKISRKELTALFVGMEFCLLDLSKEDAVKAVMEDFDTSLDSEIDEAEFSKGILKWISEVKPSAPKPSYSIRLLDFHLTQKERDLLSEKNDEVVEDVANPKWTCFKAVMLLLLGTVIAAVFADPLVDAVDDFSTATSIPSFFISFIAMPLATNSSEAVTAIIFASRKKIRTTSLTFSEIYGAATMNNILCLAVFLALVYVRDLTWDFSAEVLVIIIVVIVMGLFASFKTTFQVWTCIVAFSLYPLSIVLVYILDYVLGWS